MTHHADPEQDGETYVPTDPAARARASDILECALRRIHGDSIAVSRAGQNLIIDWRHAPIEYSGNQTIARIIQAIRDGYLTDETAGGLPNEVQGVTITLHTHRLDIEEPTP